MANLNEKHITEELFIFPLQKKTLEQKKCKKHLEKPVKSHDLLQTVRYK